MNPTIKDVARRANVSIATVSRVLNNLSGYSQKTKQKVLSAIEEMGYQPNAIARGLINKSTQTIGVLFPQVSGEFSSEVLHGIEHIAHTYNYSVVVCNTDADGMRTMKYLQVLREKQIDGIIFSSEQLTKEYYDTLQTMRVPLVLVASYSHRYSVPFVKVNDTLASYQATEYLIKKGHRKIAMISGRKGDPIAGAPRIEGFLQALRDYGIEHGEEQVVCGHFSFHGAYQAMETILQTNAEITAVFTASDEMALGAIAAASRRGLKVPDDLSIIGYDNLKLAEMAQPPLTTVEQPLFLMGKLAAEKLITMIDTGEVAEGNIVQHSIIERESVKEIN